MTLSLEYVGRSLRGNPLMKNRTIHGSQIGSVHLSGNPVLRLLLIVSFLLSPSSIGTVKRLGILDAQ